MKRGESSAGPRFRRSSAPADNCNNLRGITNQLFKKDNPANSYVRRGEEASRGDKLCVSNTRRAARVLVYFLFIRFFFGRERLSARNVERDDEISVSLFHPW